MEEGLSVTTPGAITCDPSSEDFSGGSKQVRVLC